MSWSSKVGFFFAPLLLSTSAMAQRINFHDGARGIDALVESRTVSGSRNDVAPVSIRLSIPGIDIDRTADGFDAVSVSGLSPLGVEGAPELAGTGALVAVPEGYEPKLVVVNEVQRSLEGVVVRPAQRRFRCGGSQESFSFTSDLYESQSLFPARHVALEEVGRVQGLRLVRVAINPFQMDFANRSLRVTTDLEARVEFVLVGRPTRLTMSPALHQIARASTVNGSSLAARVVRADAPETMLIFTADALKADIAPLVQWKSSKGLNVIVTTFTEAGGSKEKVKAFIQDYYDKAAVKPSYLLFVGNKTTMPVFMESTSAGNAASDYRYAILAGNDDIPDALYGRIVADNANDVKVQISRWMDYEKAPERGDWFNQAVTIASNEGSGPSDKEYGEQIGTALKAFTYKKVDAFLQGDKSATPANISAAVNTGSSWLAYFGHGSGTAWGSTVGSFNVGTVDKLANDSRLPVIIDVACQNASWVNIARPFGKAWVTHQVNGKNAGAVAFYGGSVNISWHEPAVMSVGIAKSHFEKPVRTLGGSVLAGQLHLLAKMGVKKNTIENLRWYNLLGDPSLLIRTDAPRAYRVKAALNRLGDRVEVTVTATDDQGKAVGDVLTSLQRQDAAPIAIGKTDASGEAKLVVSGVTALETNTTLTTTGYNLETYQTIVK